MIGKVFGFGKKSDYFLELEEGKGTDSAQTPSAPQQSQPAPVEVQAKEEQPKKAEKSSKKTTVKAKAKPASQEAKEEAKATIEAISVKPKELPSLNNGIEPTPAGMTFAPDYLMPKSTSGRRRPGPSMNMFKGMAGQVGSR
ncbi:MAG: hypothetical protein ACOVQ7_08490 [Limnoraphis robusta]|jgi:hypothetical protein